MAVALLLGHRAAGFVLVAGATLSFGITRLLGGGHPGTGRVEAQLYVGQAGGVKGEFRRGREHGLLNVLAQKVAQVLYLLRIKVPVIFISEIFGSATPLVFPTFLIGKGHGLYIGIHLSLTGWDAIG